MVYDELEKKRCLLQNTLIHFGLTREEFLFLKEFINAKQI